MLTQGRNICEAKETKQPCPHPGLCGRAQESNDPGLYPVALSAVLGLAPYLCVWLVTRSVLSTWPGLNGAGNLGLWGWMAVWTAVGSILLYFAALMSTHIAAFRTARNIRRAAMTHVLKLPWAFLPGTSRGGCASSLTTTLGSPRTCLPTSSPTWPPRQ